MTTSPIAAANTRGAAQFPVGATKIEPDLARPDLARSDHSRLGALRSRNCQLFFAGQFVSLIGTLINMVATNWLTYRLVTTSEAGSAVFAVGLVTFVGQIPQLFLSPLAGVWIDRLDKRALLVVTQALSMLQSFVLAALVFTHLVSMPAILVLSFVQGLINAVDSPARQTFYVQLISDRRDLPAVIALNSTLVHVSRFVGPAVAGLLIYKFGEGFCFLLDGFTYAAVIVALAALKLTQHRPPVQVRHVITEFKEGWRYSMASAPIKYLLGLSASVSFFAMSQTVLMPDFATKVLGGNEQTYGWLTSASGVGALLGSLYLASRKRVVGLERVIAAAGIGLGVALLAFSSCRWLWLSLPLLGLASFCLLLLLASANIIIQTLVDDSKRGRVMALVGVSFLGMVPLGGLVGGFAAARLGAPLTLGVAGVACTLITLGFLRRLPQIQALTWPVYLAKGKL